MFSLKNLFFVTILIGCHILACKKSLDINIVQLDGEKLQTGLIESNSEMVCNEISKLLFDLKPRLVAEDQFGHGHNLNRLVERINNYNDLVHARLLCYACIETNPPQSELILTTDTSGVELARILDISTPDDDLLTCIRLH